MATPQRPTEKPYDLIDNFRYFDFNRSLNWLNYFGKLHFGNTFNLYPEDKEIMHKLLIYFIRDEVNCKKEGLDLNKGILLTGPIGCGKTSLMTIMKHFTYLETNYFIKSSREIATEFHQEGFPTLQKYGKAHKIYCFDDLGVEQQMKHFGNACNTMGEILLSRYDLSVHSGIVTHCTTNLNAKELEDIYGNRVRSRLRQLFNLVGYDGKTGDKRK